MTDLPIKVVYTTMGQFIAKVQELTDRELGEPDCALIDCCVWEEKLAFQEHDEEGNHITHEHGGFICMRFPNKTVTDDRSIVMHSSNFLTIVEPTQALVSEYLVTISD